MSFDDVHEDFILKILSECPCLFHLEANVYLEYDHIRGQAEQG